MGPNGAGKSTLSASSWASPATRSSPARSRSTASTAALPAWERAAAGLHLVMQYPTEVPGVAARRRAHARRWPAAAGRPTVSTRCSRPRRARIGFDERFLAPGAQRRPVGRREEAQRDAAARRAPAPHRHPRRARLRSRHRRAARLRPPRRGDEQRADGDGDPLGVLAITHYNRLLHELQPDACTSSPRVASSTSGGPELADAARGRRLRGVRRRRRGRRRRPTSAPRCAGSLDDLFALLTAPTARPSRAGRRRPP